VTSLEPRTPHQPGKPQKLSKNDYLCTLFISGVNEKQETVSVDFSIECRWFTGGCSKDGAVWAPPRLVTRANAQFSGMLLATSAESRQSVVAVFVKIVAKPVLDKTLLELVADNVVFRPGRIP